MRPAVLTEHVLKAGNRHAAAGIGGAFAWMGARTPANTVSLATAPEPGNERGALALGLARRMADRHIVGH